MNYTYLLKCADGTLYCGWTSCLEERVRVHNEGKGAKYTRPRRPVELVYFECFETRQEAMRREAAIKKLSRLEKINLIMKNSCDKEVHHDIMTETASHNKQMEDLM